MIRVKFIGLSLFMLLFTGVPLAAQNIIYTANGKTVSREVYEAMCLTNESGELLRQNKAEDALKKVRKAVELAPDLAEAQCNLGLTLGRLGATDEAIEHLNKAVSLNPDLTLAWLDLGSIYQTTGQTDKALKTFKICLERFPRDQNAQRLKSMIGILEREQATRKQNDFPCTKDKLNGDYFSEACGRPTKWAPDRMPVKVYFENAASVPGFVQAYREAALQAFKEWASASQGKISFAFVQHPDTADIIFRWTNDVRKVSQPAEGGEAKVYPSNKGIHRASIVILTIDPAPELKLTPELMKIVCLHEIGHTLGLLGHSSNPQDILYSTIPIAYEGRSLSSRDQNTLRLLYADSVKNAPITSSGR